ncbi:MAG: chemotaxis protein CheA [Clostridia bacterium]|nr:chemotaxis protein CheA [Clostridia bacterium]MDD4047605.1 chemotaxis protein CheA [Clostridia bacterium]
MDVSQYLDIFLEESMEHLQTLNSGVLNMENNPERLDIIDEIFRAAHTLKGMSATMGYNAIAKLTHSMENLLDKIRSGKILPNPEITNSLFKCVDVLEEMVNSIREGGAPDADIEGLMKTLVALENGENPTEGQAETLKSEEIIKNEVHINEYDINIFKEAEQRDLNIWKISIHISPECLMKGVRAFMVFRNLEEIGEIVKAVPEVQDIEDEKFDDHFILFLVSKYNEKEIYEALNISEVAAEEIERVSSESVKVDIECTNEEIGLPKNIQKAEIEEDNTKNKENNKILSNKKSKIHQTVRVDIGRLDSLMNLVGELVINKTRLEQISISSDMDGLNETIEHLDRVTTDIQSVVQNIRMVSVEQVFNRFPRMVRDLSKELGKDIDLILEGKETELDRTVIDEIGDPLVHLIRNAIDHGLESPEDRKISGKNTTGILKLIAKHDGNQVTICVEDDGRGLNVDVIKEKALKKKLVTLAEIEEMDEQEIVNMIFLSGFSTAKEVTDISGRGVGLDVVKNKIASLNGQVSVVTKQGQGSQFIIKLPLTLAIIQALLVKVQEETFAIPLANIDETTNLERGKIKNIQNQQVMILRDKVLPLIFIRDILDVPGTKETGEIYVVVVEKGERKFGLVVEELIGQQEIVISSFGKLLSGLSGIAGATILGDGSISLILDIGALL